MRNNRGMTLVELIIYMALSVVAGVMLWAFQNITRSTQNASVASYLVNGDTETCVAVLRRDINESALGAIQVYPSEAAPGEAPGMSLVSSRAFGGEDEGRQLINSWGAPQWDKHVYYTLEGEGASTGKLVRWEKELEEKTMLPVPALLLPSSQGRPKSKVLLRDVLLPSKIVDKVGPSGSVSTDGYGGFKAQFLRRRGGSGGEEQFTGVNPKNGNPRDNTRLLQVELQILQDGKNYYSVTFLAAARH